MPYINQAQTGFLKSIPKLTRINGDDNLKVVYRNLGNNHAYPFVWADTYTVASGITEITLASGIKFHGYDLASYATVVVTPCYNAGTVYITKDTAANTIKCTVANAGANNGSSRVNAMFMLGTDPEVGDIYCRGNGTPMPSLP